jgi:SEC-C motif
VNGEDASRLEASIEGMRDYYPTFSLSIVETGAGRQTVWTGRVQPIGTMDSLEELLDDIHHERPYYILPGGEVLHHPACTASHAQHGWSERLTNPHTVYELEVRYGGGRRHPRAYVRDPPPPEKNLPHTFSDGSICPYAPWHQVWLWDEHTVVNYMGHILGWLIKRTVWEQVGIWIGPEVSHDARFLLRSIGPNKQCWCGSGTKYKKCHRRSDEAATSAK